MVSVCGVTVVAYFMKILSGSRNYVYTSYVNCELFKKI